MITVIALAGLALVAEPAQTKAVPEAGGVTVLSGPEGRCVSHVIKTLDFQGFPWEARSLEVRKTTERIEVVTKGVYGPNIPMVEGGGAAAHCDLQGNLLSMQVSR